MKLILALLLTCTFIHASTLETTQPVLSKKAYNLLFSHEVSTESYNESPSVLGPSGVTIGIGYDLAYTTKEKFYNDWSNYLSEHDMQRLALCIGLSHNKSLEILPNVADIIIPLETAETVFKTVCVPNAIANTLRAFPQADKLPPDAFGALVSLVYNRGSYVYDKPESDRRKEMLEIRKLITNGHYEQIPASIRSMKRLWKSEGLSNRREAEASLVEAALDTKG